MVAKLSIVVPVHNRREIVEQCLPTIVAGADDIITVYDDGSTEFESSGELHHLGAHVVKREEVAIGIEAQRRMHFRDYFLYYKKEGFTHFYLTDSDALHDPGWREAALKLQEFSGGAPVCLYNTIVHARLPGNTIMDDSDCPVVWRRVAPGISYLLTNEHVKIVMEHIDEIQNWDWDVPRFLGHQFAISQTSYVDHIGHGGLHHPERDGVEGGDRALHPTEWLKVKRAEVIVNLCKASKTLSGLCK